MNAFGDIRAILQRGASEATWEALCDVLVEQFGEVRRGEEGDLLALLDYCTEHLKSWPKDLPTFAPRSWFQMPSWIIAERALTPFFVHCFMERTDTLYEDALRGLQAYDDVEPPAPITLDALGPLRWRHGGAMDAVMVRRLLAMLREKCAVPAPEVDEPLVRLRQFIDDGDCQRLSERLDAQANALPNEAAHRWARYQLAYLGGRHQLDIWTLADLELHHVDYLVYDDPELGRAEREELEHKVSMLGLFGDSTSLTLLCRLALDEPPHAFHGRFASATLDHEMARRSCSCLQTFLRRETDYNAPALNDFASAAQATRWSLVQCAQVCARAMIVRTQFAVSSLLELIVDVEELDDVAFGWIIFSTHEGVFFRWTSNGPRDVHGARVEMNRHDVVTIAHPLLLDRAGELYAWWELFVEASMDEVSVQLERELYEDLTTCLPHLGFRIVHTELSSVRPDPTASYALDRVMVDAALGLVWEEHVGERDVTYEEKIIWSFGPPRRTSALVYTQEGYDFALVFEVSPYRLDAVHRISIRALLGRGALDLDDPILLSEVGRVVRVVLHAWRTGDYDGEALLP